MEAASTVRTLGAGLTFTPVDVAKPDNTFARQVVTAMRHVATDPTCETGTLLAAAALTPPSPPAHRRPSCR